MRYETIRALMVSLTGFVAILITILSTPHIPLDVVPGLIGGALCWYGGRLYGDATR